MNIGVELRHKIQLFRNMVMLHIKFKGTTYTVTWKQTCAAIFKSFIKKIILSFRLNYPVTGLNFSRFLDNLNSRLAKTSFMQSIGLKA